tara:strand:+ start:405 stop:581 length:177 start_codon:yes stop_codon:yes gene_type:complete
MKSTGLIQVIASFFLLGVVTGVLFGFDFVSPLLDYLNTTTGFIFLLVFAGLLLYAKER